MRVKLKNVGDAMRVVYDMTRTMVSIPIGQERVVNLAGKAVDKLRQAQTKGDTLHVSAAPQRVRVQKPDDGQPAAASRAEKQKVPEQKKPEEMTATDVLAMIDSFEYHPLLAAVTRLAPDNKLPPRPTRTQMIDVLRKVSNAQT